MASDKLSFQIRGLKDLERALRELPNELQQDMLKPALQAGGDVLKAGMVRRLPRRTGAVAGSIQVLATTAGKTAGTTIVGSEKLGYILRFLEYGVKAHAVVATAFQRKRGKRRGHGKRALAGAGFGPVASAQHPATPGQHYMARTTEEDGPSAVKAFAQVLYDKLAAYCARQPKAAA